MADDRLDDAIDAVVRAVDRIERATRGQRTLAPEPAAIESELEVDELEDDDERAVSPDMLPPATSVSPGRDAWVGAPDDRSQHRGGKKKHKKKHKARPIEPAEPLLADEGDDDNTFPTEQPLPDAPPAPLPAEPRFAPPAPPPPAPPAHAPAEVHELVGRIVARTQELDDHLEASRQLRTEITELVARLAAASTHQR